MIDRAPTSEGAAGAAAVLRLLASDSMASRDAIREAGGVASLVTMLDGDAEAEGSLHSVRLVGVG